MKASPKFDKSSWRLFLKKGTCSRTMFYILNHEFEQPKAQMEPALDPMAGGIMQMGHQCGMLWGATMAVSAEAYRRNSDVNKSTALAVHATKMLLNSFEKRTGTHDCKDLLGTIITSNKDILKTMITGRFIRCFKTMDKWAPEAIQSAYEGLSLEIKCADNCKSCASEVVKKMEGSEEEAATVAGLAGGIGLSGKACGALSAAIWYKTLQWSKENPNKAGFPNEHASALKDTFAEYTNGEFLCRTIANRQFANINEHTEFLNQGGCEKLLNYLAK